MPAAPARKPEPHVHPQPKPRGFVSFGPIESEIEAKLREAQKSLAKFPAVPKAKFTSRWEIFKHPYKKKLVGGGKGGWLIIHPLKLYSKLFRGPKAKAAYKRDKARYAATEALRKDLRIEERFQSVYNRYENRMRASANHFRDKVNDPSTNPGEISFLHAKFSQQVAEARQAFRGQIKELIHEYRQNAVEKGIIRGHNLRDYPPKAPV